MLSFVIMHMSVVDTSKKHSMKPLPTGLCSVIYINFFWWFDDIFFNTVCMLWARIWSGLCAFF